MLLKSIHLKTLTPWISPCHQPVEVFFRTKIIWPLCRESCSLLVAVYGATTVAISGFFVPALPSDWKIEKIASNNSISDVTTKWWLRIPNNYLVVRWTIQEILCVYSGYEKRIRANYKSTVLVLRVDTSSFFFFFRLAVPVWPAPGSVLLAATFESALCNDSLRVIAAGSVASGFTPSSGVATFWGVSLSMDFCSKLTSFFLAASSVWGLVPFYWRILLDDPGKGAQHVIS